MSADGTMTYYLAMAAKKMREELGRMHVHIAATMNKDQSTIYRFEQGVTVPRDINLMVAAYADDLDTTPIQIWERALKMWKTSKDEATVEELLIQAREAKARAQKAKAKGLPRPGQALLPRQTDPPTNSASQNPQ